MSDKLPDWRPIHSHGIRSGDLVFYSHKAPLEIIPDIEGDGIFSEAGRQDIARMVTSRAVVMARFVPMDTDRWELMKPETKKAIIRSFLNALSNFNGLIVPARYRFFDENPDQSSEVDIEVGMSGSGAPLVSFRTCHDFAGRVVHDAIEMAAKRPRMKADIGHELRFSWQIDALMIALTMFPHEFFEKINEWLLPGVYIDFNERESQGNPCTQFVVMSQNKRNIAHVDLPSARAGHEAALSKGNKEPWTRTRFTIGGATA